MQDLSYVLTRPPPAHLDLSGSRECDSDGVGSSGIKFGARGCLLAGSCRLDVANLLSSRMVVQIGGHALCRYASTCVVLESGSQYH